MVKISTVIQIIFAEKFVSQDYAIRAAPGLTGPTNTVVVYIIFIVTLFYILFKASQLKLSLCFSWRVVSSLGWLLNYSQGKVAANL